jgi:hypothetical protein
MPYTSEALKKENVKENLGKARLANQAVFAVQLSILNRMSFLAGGFAELRRQPLLRFLRSARNCQSIPAVDLSREATGTVLCVPAHLPMIRYSGTGFASRSTIRSDAGFLHTRQIGSADRCSR